MRDVKRAFAIVESSGAVHLVVTTTDEDYFMWVRTILPNSILAQFSIYIFTKFLLFIDH